MASYILNRGRSDHYVNSVAGEVTCNCPGYKYHQHCWASEYVTVMECTESGRQALAKYENKPVTTESFEERMHKIQEDAWKSSGLRGGSK